MSGDYPDGVSDMHENFWGYDDYGVVCDECGYEEYDIHGEINSLAGMPCPDCGEVLRVMDGAELHERWKEANERPED